MPFEDGPFVQAACLCEKVIEDKTGVFSLIRIIDTITHNQAGSSPPEKMPAFTHSFTLVIMIKSGAARGRSDLKIIPELPDGSALDPIIVTVHLDGEEKGYNLIAEVAFQFPLEGLYWFDVYLDTKKITALPLRVKYNRVISGKV